MRRATFLFVAVALGACNQNVINTPIRSFDRPSDVALTCVRGNPVAQHLYDAHPLTDCTPQQVADVPDGGLPLLQRALVTQSARGELSLVDVSTNQLVDLRPEVPGFGFLPVGAMPTHVRVTPDGCAAVTSNVDSCDLALVDLPTLYNSPRIGVLQDGGLPDGSPLADNSDNGVRADVVRRLRPTVNGRPLLARPTWVEVSPDSQSATHGYDPGGVAGQCEGGDYKAWVALPSCQLVVEVDLHEPHSASFTESEEQSAEVIQAVRVTESGASVVTDPSTITCPEECAPQAGFDAGVSDLSEPPDLAPPGGNGDGGAPADLGPPSRLPTNQAYPGTLALDFENGVGRLFIGDLTGEKVSIVPIDPATGKLGTPREVELEKGALGVSVVRVSPRSEAGKFLYAIARDGSVRVIDLDREVECETNPDPRYLSQSPPDPDPLPDARRLGCFPLGDPSTPPRSPLFTSPGIQLQNGALPRDVAFVHLDLLPLTDPAAPPPSAGPTVMVGDFAWIVGSDGRATVVDLFDACPAPNAPQQSVANGPFTPACSLGNVAASRAQAELFPGNPVPLENDRLAHRIRQSNDRFFTVSQGDNGGAPRLDDPVHPFSVTVNGVAAEATPVLELPDGGASDLATPLPQQVDGGTDGGVVGVGELPGLVSELDPHVQGAVRTVAFEDTDHLRNETWNLAWEGLIPATQRALGRLAAGSPPTLTDSGAAFCARGVQAGDELVLRGCTQDTDCDFAQTCMRDPGAPKDVPNGMCLDRDDKLRQMESQSCSALLRSLRAFRIVSARQGVTLPSGDVTDQLELDEIAEPDDERRSCATDADCGTIAAADASGNPVDLTTSCLPDWDGQKRCLRTCQPNGSGVQCGTDFVCAPSRHGGARCLRGPLTDDLLTPISQGGAGCVRELQSYEIHGGDAFVVSGSVSGFLSDLEPDPTTRECVVPPISSPFVRLHQPRIPIDPAALTRCPAGADILDPMNGAPAVCLFQDADQAHDRQIHFENPYFALGLNLPRSRLVPPDGTVLSFNVIGGGVPLTVALQIDAQAQQPIAAMTAPDRSTVYVVDEGKSTTGTGLRGQLFRLFSATQAVDQTFIIR